MLSQIDPNISQKAFLASTLALLYVFKRVCGRISYLKTNHSVDLDIFRELVNLIHSLSQTEHNWYKKHSDISSCFNHMAIERPQLQKWKFYSVRRIKMYFKPLMWFKRGRLNGFHEVRSWNASTQTPTISQTPQQAED